MNALVENAGFIDVCQAVPQHYMSVVPVQRGEKLAEQATILLKSKTPNAISDLASPLDA